MRRLLAVLLALVCGACGSDSSTMTPASPTPSPTPHAALPEPLETELAAIRAALKRRLGDDTPFDDPFQRSTFRTGDFALAAYIRLTGPSHFSFADPDTASVIGYTLPNFSDAERKALRAQA